MKTTQMKSTLAESNRRLELENGLLSCVLADAIRGDILWFEASREWSIGISRPASPCGGMAIVRLSGRTCTAHYFEDVSRSELAHIANCITGADTDANRELLARRRAIEAAQAYISAKQQAA